MTQYIYSTERLPHMEGRTFRNPRHFFAPEKDATKVYINGHWPEVRDAYEAAGVTVAPAADMRAMAESKASAKIDRADPDPGDKPAA